MNTRSSSGTVTRTAVEEGKTNDKKSAMVLKLKPAHKPAIQWTEDTVDNENLGRKSSKRKLKFCSNINLFGEHS